MSSSYFGTYGCLNLPFFFSFNKHCIWSFIRFKLLSFLQPSCILWSDYRFSGWSVKAYLYIPRFYISVDTETYHECRIGFWGIWYDKNSITLVLVSLVFPICCQYSWYCQCNMYNLADFWYYKPSANIATGFEF